MQSSFGQQLNINIFGESHGEMIGVLMNGLAPGIKLDLDFINQMMDKRKAKDQLSTNRKESDEIKIVSGYFNGHTTGTPLCIVIENNETKSKDYAKSKDLMRPSHADYAGNEKYLGFQDYRGGGHFSGRLTAPLVAAGAICTQILKQKNIMVGTHILSIKDVKDKSFNYVDENVLGKQLQHLNTREFPTLSPTVEEAMKELILSAKENGDSVGGILESAIIGMPSGIGEPMFNSIESTLSHLLYSIPALKGLEFGLGFEFANKLGSEANDAFKMVDGNVKTTTNNNGGINGGISNGMPIIIKSVIKPTPSIYKPQQTINYATKEDTLLQIEGRHDPAIIHRARVVVDACIAIGLVDLCSMRYGYMWQVEDSQ